MQAPEEAIARVMSARPEIAAAWLFGSLARGAARPDSDADVAVLLRDPAATAADVHRMLGGLALDLEHALGRRIDLVVLEARSSPILAHRVLAEGRLAYDADPERRIGFEWRSAVRYLDFRPTWEIAARHAVDGLAAWLDERRAAR